MTTSGTRKTPTSTELAAWREYIEAADEMKRAVSSAMQEQSGVSSGDYSVLLALSEADAHRLRSSALADGIGWERSRLSHHLGRMEKRGLVGRERCGDDNRGAWITLTPEGSRLFRTASAAHFPVIRRLFVDALDVDELNAVRTASAALRRHVRSAVGVDRGVSQDD